MKTIGMIGGMSWESTLEYYRIINEEVKKRLGGLHSAKCVLVSVEFAEIEALQRAGDWDRATQAMIAAARQVEAGGADFVIICTNTMHKMAGEMQASLQIPLLHIADATAQAILAWGLHTVGLLGTRFTMEENFYRDRLSEGHNLLVLIPPTDDRAVIHKVIYEELVRGVINPASKSEFQRILADLAGQGAEGMVLGCTEIGLLIKYEDSGVPLFDTTRLHAVAAVEMALA
jgi:aspartate racemase